jgi:hypothetical protein
MAIAIHPYISGQPFRYPCSLPLNTHIEAVLPARLNPHLR